MSGRGREIVNLSMLAEVIDEDRTVDQLPPVTYAQPHHRLPDYIRHQEGIGQLGVLTSESMARQFEAAAKSVEAMGTQMVDLIKRCDEVRDEALAAMRKCEETAVRYREEGRRQFEQIEGHALLVQHVTNTCTELQRKIAAITEA